MTFFKEWCFCICLTLVISVIFSLFTPRGAMQRFYKIIISVFIFISFVYPLRDFDAEDFRVNEDSLVFDINDNASVSYENQINSSVKAFLIKENIEGCNVKSRVRFNAQSSEIEISELVVYIPDEYAKEDVKKLIFDELGLNSRVVYLGE